MAATAHVPFGLGAVLPSAAVVGGPRTVPDALFMRSRAPWTGASWQRCSTAQPQAAIASGLLAQPKPTDQTSQNYPHTTRIGAGNSDGKGPHPVRDPV